MIAGAARYDTARFFLIAEFAYFVGGAADLEASGSLTVFCLNINVVFSRNIGCEN